MKQKPCKTILFLTGAYVSHSCWNNWRIYFESKGYTTLAPAWPHKDADAETLRNRHPDRALATVTMDDILQHYTNVIMTLPEKPILIGHSFGGLFAQVLLNRGYGAAAVAMHAVPPQGVIPYEFNFLKSNVATLGFFTDINETYLLPFRKWQFSFTNGLPLDIQKSSYYELAIPESKLAVRGGLGKSAFVDFKKEHEPLLLLAGSRDQCIPEHLCRRVFKRYKNKTSVTEYVVRDRNHFVLGLPSWKADADYIHEWLYKVL